MFIAAPVTYGRPQALPFCTAYALLSSLASAFQVFCWKTSSLCQRVYELSRLPSQCLPCLQVCLFVQSHSSSKSFTSEHYFLAERLRYVWRSWSGAVSRQNMDKSHKKRKITGSLAVKDVNTGARYSHAESWQYVAGLSEEDCLGVPGPCVDVIHSYITNELPRFMGLSGSSRQAQRSKPWKLLQALRWC